MSDKRLADLLALYAFGKLEDPELAEVEAYIAEGGDDVARELAQLEEAAAAVELGLPQADVSRTSRDALFAKVRGEAARATADEIAPVSESTELVGREDTVSQLTDRLARLTKGDGGYLALEGEAGIGKSCMVAELEALAERRGILVLQGSSGQSGSDLGYQPWVESLGQWAAAAGDGELSEATLVAAFEGIEVARPAEVMAATARLLSVPLSSERARPLAELSGDALEKAIQRSVSSLLAAISSRRALIVVFEDLHWADPSTLELLESCAELVDRSPILFVGVARPGYADTSARIRAKFHDDHVMRFDAVDLSAFNVAEVRSLTRRVLGANELPEEIVEFVAHKCGGNPFYTEQTLRALLDAGTVVADESGVSIRGELPDRGDAGSAATIVAERIAGLPAFERDVLEVAAVVGRYVHRRVLESFFSDRRSLSSALSSLEEKALLMERRSRSTASGKVVTLAAERGYVFKHALVHDAVYDGIVEARKRELHLRCAGVVEDVFDERIDDFFAALATHYARAERLEEATGYLLKAGGHAASSAASEEALRLFREAHRVYRLAYGASGPKPLEAELEGNLAHALLSTGRLGESIEHFNSALRLRGQWVPKSRLGLYAKLAWDAPNVLARLYAGRVLVPRDTTSDDVRSTYALMYSRCRAQNIVDVERNFFDNFAVFHFCARHGDPDDTPHVAGSFAATGAFFAWAGLSPAIGQRFLEVAEGATVGKSQADRFLYEAMAFVHHFHVGDWDARHDIAPEIYEEGLRHGMLWDADVYLGLRCERDIRQGAFERAREGIAGLERLKNEHGYAFAESNEMAQAAYIALEERDLGEAESLLDRWYAARQEKTLHLIALGSKAKAQALADNLDGATGTLADADKILASESSMTPYYRVVLEASRLRTGLGRFLAGGSQSEARGALAAAEKQSAKVFRERPEVLGLAGSLEWASGRKDAAEKAWREALALCEREGVRPEAARIAREIGLALADAGAGEVAGTTSDGWLDRAKEGLADLGLERELEQLDAERAKRRRVA